MLQNCSTYTNIFTYLHYVYIYIDMCVLLSQWYVVEILAKRVSFLCNDTFIQDLKTPDVNWAVTSWSWLLAVYRGSYYLPSYIGVIIIHYKDPLSTNQYNGMSFQGFECCSFSFVYHLESVQIYTVFVLCGSGRLPVQIPDAQCMVYLPTFTPKTTQM